jgi:hypothetical protein
METLDSTSGSPLAALARFALAPFRLRTYANFLYLALAFPLGLGYFIFLTVGLATGLGLTIVWIGLPILALTFLGSFGLAALERLMAIHLLGATVPPMTRPVPGPEPRKFGRVAADFFGNPVTWKSIAFLLVKFPLGIISFVVLVTLSSVTAAFLLAPLAWMYGGFDVDFDFIGWQVTSLAQAWLLVPFGVGLAFVALNLVNLMGWGWKGLATQLLGSERFRPEAAPPAERIEAAATA